MCIRDRVYAPPGEASIGRSLAVRGIRAAGLELAEAPVGRDDLPRMDELFFIDHRGVTALSRCDGLYFNQYSSKKHPEVFDISF